MTRPPNHLTLQKKQKMALVIGISMYEQIPSLKNTVKDAKTVSAKLEDIGFSVTKKFDLNRTQFIQAITNFSRAAEGSETIAFYYAGHGFSTDGENYLIPSNVELNNNELFNDRIPQHDSSRDIIVQPTSRLAAQSISLSEIISLVSGSAKASFFLIDACRNNPFQNMIYRSTEKSEFTRGLNLVPLSASAGTLIGYSTSPGEEALDTYGDAAAGGPYAEAIAAVDHKKHYTLTLFLHAVAKRVFSMTSGRQRPWFNASLFEPIFLADPPGGTSPNTMRRRAEGAVANVDDPRFRDLLRNSNVQTSTGTNLKYDTKTKTLKTKDLLVNSVFKNGLNSLKVAGEYVWTWFEERRLHFVTNFYTNSAALIFAVSDYPDRLNLAGYDDMPLIAAQAKRLKVILQQYGFQEDQIDIISDGSVTKSRIDRELRRFWPSGDRSDTDRLFIYFAGHGNIAESTIRDRFGNPEAELGYFVGADTDPQQSEATSFLLNELVTTHFQLLSPEHVAVFIDACAAGLTARPMSNFQVSPSLDDFPRLARLYEHLNKPARNLLVAGTSQKAVYYDDSVGPLFTSQLVQALEQGTADINGNGIITFTEIAVKVREEVIPLAMSKGVEQSPQMRSRDNTSMIFLKDPN